MLITLGTTLPSPLFDLWELQHWSCSTTRSAFWKPCNNIIVITPYTEFLPNKINSQQISNSVCCEVYSKSFTICITKNVRMVWLWMTTVKSHCQHLHSSCSPFSGFTAMMMWITKCSLTSQWKRMTSATPSPWQRICAKRSKITHQVSVSIVVDFSI